MDAVVFTGANDGLSVVAYPGDNKILLAMSLTDESVGKTDGKNLAGFAIWRTLFGQKEAILSNRIGFTIAVEGASDGKWTPSDKAPFQKFRWIDVPPDGFDKPIGYRIRALFFSGEGHDLKDGPEVTLNVQPARNRHSAFRAAFTRGYIASQAYADKFGNKDIRPSGAKTPTFDTSPYQAQYKWLGADARELLMDFIADCEKDKEALVDVFAYDLDEPDVIAAICAMGKQGRLRAILDNAPLRLAVQNPQGQMGDITSFAALTKNVPAPFTKEFSGGPGMHIHDKFVIVDFNGDNPTVFSGSSNLAAGGEVQNGDSLAMIEDASIANMFAVEALALFDHYHFRSNAAKATKADPITLWSPDKGGTPWWQAYYDQTSIKMRDRCLFAKIELPAGMKSVKSVDWASVDAADSASKTGSSGSHRKSAGAPAKSAARATSGAKAKPAKARATKKTVAKKASTKKVAAKKTAAKPATKRKPTKTSAKRKPAARKTAAKKRARKRA